MHQRLSLINLLEYSLHDLEACCSSSFLASSLNSVIVDDVLCMYMQSSMAVVGKRDKNSRDSQTLIHSQLTTVVQHVSWEMNIPEWLLILLVKVPLCIVQKFPHIAWVCRNFFMAIHYWSIFVMMMMMMMTNNGLP